MNDGPLPAPKPATAPHGGQNGDVRHPVGALDRAMFADIVAQRDREPEPVTKISPKAEAEEAPETVVADPPATDEPANENLTEEKPEGEGDEPKSEDAGETDLSQSDDKELNEALQGLNADAKESLMEVAKAIANGETTIGQVKRQMKLGRQENEELQRLREENEQLKANPPTATVSRELPPTVAKLKTVEEVESRSQVCEESIDALEDFLEKNPQGGEIGGKEWTREQLIDRKRAFRDELKVLPKQQQIIQQQAQFTKVKTEAAAQIRKDFPVLNDPDNPDTKASRALLKTDPIINQYPNADYLALALARGHRELQAELTARKAGTAARTVQRPGAKTGTVPAAKPHGSGTAPARSTNGTAPVGDLLKGVKDKSSLADLLAATGR